MKKLVEHVKTHRKIVHAHLKKHHKKYVFGVLSAALLIKIIPAFIAGLATWHFNYLFADEPVTTDTETSTASWGEEYKHGDFEYIIEGVDLNVYPIDSSKTTTVTTTDEGGGTTTITKNDDMKKYISEEPEKIISLNSEDLTINPEYKRGTIDDYNTLFIDLNLNLTKDYLESKLSDEISKTTDEKSYIVDVVVKYKIKNYPTNFQYFLKVNYGRFIGGLLSESSNGEVNINGTISQVINVATITKEDSDSDPEVIIINEDNDLFSSIISYLILSEEDCEGIGLDIDSSGAHMRQFCGYDENDYENVEYVDSSKIQLFMFYTMDNIDYIKNGLELEYEEDNDEGDNGGDDNGGDDNGGDDNGGDDNGGDDNGGNNTDNTCSSNDVLVTAPISGAYLQSENVRLTWTLSGSDCSGKIFAIKLYNGNDSGSYSLLGTVSANSGEFSNLEDFNISGLVETNFAIYLVEDSEIIESVKEGPTFFIDNIKPEIIDSTYAFDPARTTVYGLNDKVNVSFTGSEELTGITVNVLGRNATFVSRSGLKYNYTIQLSSGNNTGQFGYNISFSDLAGNTGYYEYFNSGLTLDTTKPELSGLQFRRISDKTGFVSFTTTKPSNITFKYVLSGGKATETLTAQNTTGMRSNLVKARTDRTGYVYKYVITLEDLLGNKNYYAGTFQLSGDSLGYTLVTANGDSISNGTTTNILSTLSDEINAFSGCKNSLNMKYKSMQYTVQNRFWFKPEVPTFDDSSVQDTAELLVTLLAGTGGLSKSSITGLTQAKVNSFQEDLNNYLVIIKIKRDPDVCNAHLSLLPSLYMSKFMKTLKSYKLIK